MPNNKKTITPTSTDKSSLENKEKQYSPTGIWDEAAKLLGEDFMSAQPGEPTTKKPVTTTQKRKV